MPQKTLNPVRCPVCGGNVEGVFVDEASILEAKRVPVLVPAKCKAGHPVVLFVDKTFTVRDVEAAGKSTQNRDELSSVDKARSWMDSF